MAKKTNPRSLAHVLNAIDEYEKATRARRSKHPRVAESLQVMADMRARLEPLAADCGDHIVGAVRLPAKAASKRPEKKTR